MKKLSSVVCVGLVVLILIASFKVLSPIGQLFYTEWRSERSQRGLHERTYQNLIRPTARWVTDFAKQNGRLPNEAEINHGNIIKYPDYAWVTIQVKPNPGEAWGVVGVDFVLSVDNADWRLFYSSWNKSEFKVWLD